MRLALTNSNLVQTYKIFEGNDWWKIYRVFGLRNQTIVVYHDSNPQISWNDSIPHTSTNY